MPLSAELEGKSGKVIHLNFGEPEKSEYYTWSARVPHSSLQAKNEIIIFGRLLPIQEHDTPPDILIRNFVNTFDWEGEIRGDSTRKSKSGEHPGTGPDDIHVYLREGDVVIRTGMYIEGIKPAPAEDLDHEDNPFTLTVTATRSETM